MGLMARLNIHKKGALKPLFVNVLSGYITTPWSNITSATSSLHDKFKPIQVISFYLGHKAFDKCTQEYLLTQF